MSVGLLLITHPKIGEALLEVATQTLGDCPLRVECLEIPHDSDRDLMEQRAAECMVELDDGDGVLVLTDAYGSTPSNIACALTDTARAAVIAGLNLPMLLRIFNYQDEPLESLYQKAADGGARGIHVFAPRITPVRIDR